jgi:hypothetical protein
VGGAKLVPSNDKRLTCLMIRLLFSTVLAGVALAPLALPARAADCGRAISHFRSLIDRDVRTGMLDQSVYNAATRELARPAAACQAGHDGTALSELAAIKRRHGYH